MKKMEVNLDHALECVSAFAKGKITVDEFSEQLSRDEQKLIMISYRIVEEMSGADFEANQEKVEGVVNDSFRPTKEVGFKLSACNKAGELVEITVNGTSSQKDF